ncbi:hypothetical protein AB6E05_10795 [Vibrio alginolyticus]|uniref:hypothetical protein n=1 Tax=Vibrio TaxID=662 RepID=UPI00215E09E8|nr:MULTISPECIES: hypothetical protein [Vibrio]EKD1484341.1 hypothetical protein [Vibrio alginolyticus]ELA7329677.1 hypothetical protein [Vibrio parahaemolyticus]MCS0414003.1 hypothetical protein [Vibrio diabolicus]MDW3169122.1 hypothetical protein [Vibrio sp. Y184]
MIRIEINEERQELAKTNPDWITEQIKGRLEQSIPVCVKVHITLENVNMTLSCGDCVSGASGGRLPNEEERRVLAIWEDFGCGKMPINISNIVKFLKYFNR